jgi:hypothetical protein
MYHATIYTNTREHRMINSIGTGLNRETAERIVRDLNMALAVLGANAYAELTGEEN